MQIQTLSIPKQFTILESTIFKLLHFRFILMVYKEDLIISADLLNVFQVTLQKLDHASF